MANKLEPINSAEHKNTKINTQAGFGHMAAVHLSPVTIHEVADVVANFPIVLVKDADTGQVRMVALFGLAPGENLFVRDGKWTATYLPNYVGSQPFVPARLDEPDRFVICLEVGSPMVGDEGEPLFNEDGSDTELFTRVKKMMEQLVEQEGITTAFVAELEKLGLLKEVAIQLGDQDKQMRELNGIYTLNSQRLHDLPKDDLVSLHDKGFLGAAYAINHSFAQLKRLIQLHNEGAEKPIVHVHVRDLEAGKAQ